MAKQFKTSNDPDLFAATPPLEALKIIISLAATRDRRYGKLNKKIIVNDVSRAYFYARSDAPTFVEICEEDWEPGDESRCGELNVSMYGTRQAAQNWQRCVTEVLTKNGFRQARSSPCIFSHPEKDIATMVHGDDFVSAGTENALRWMQKIVKAAFEISTTIIGPESRDKKQVRVLNRTVTYTNAGIESEPDPRHAEIILKDLGLEASNSVVTPGEADEPVGKDDEKKLSEEQMRKFKSVVARANYLALDRPEIQFATKECAKAMSAPTVGDMRRLKRLGRYLRGHPRTTNEFAWQDWVGELTVHTDANWAGDKKTRRSTSGGTIQMGRHLIKSWSKTQSLVALSSAESELYACVKSAAEALGVMAILKDLGMEVSTKVFADASAALGIIARKGLGKVRHIDTSFLWIQEASAKRAVQFEKVKGNANMADLMTKYVPREILDRHFQSLRLKKNQARPEAANHLVS